MKKYFLLAGLGLSLAACQKDETNIVPATIETQFDWDFKLAYRQQAKLFFRAKPELNVALSELQYTFCPKNANCIIGDFVAPTLTVTDAQGQTQQVTLPKNVGATPTETWIDTTSIRANNRRYLFYYLRYEVAGKADQPAKKDLAVVLRVSRPN